MNWRTLVTEIPRGNAGNVRTLAAMSMLAKSGAIDPVVVQAAQDAVRPYPERSPDSDFSAILADVRRRMRYTHDPLDAEVVKHPRYVIERTNSSGMGEPMDCDDASVLAGAMLGAIGYPTQFVTVASDPDRPAEWSHVYLQALHPNGAWVPLDPIVRDFAVGQEVPAARLTAPRAYHEGAGPMIAGGIRGVGSFGRATGVGHHRAGLGYCSRGMADDPTDPYYSNSPVSGASLLAPAGASPSSGDAFANVPGGNPSGGGSSGAPWYASLASGLVAGGANVFGQIEKSNQLASQAQIAQANARYAMAVRGAAPATSFFRNPDGSLNAVKVAIGVGVAAVVGAALLKAFKR